MLSHCRKVKFTSAMKHDGVKHPSYVPLSLRVLCLLFLLLRRRPLTDEIHDEAGWLQGKVSVLRVL